MYEVTFAAAEDVPAMLEIYRPYADGTTVSFEWGAPSLEAFSARIEKIMSAYPVLACKKEGVVCGYAYASAAFERKSYAWSVDLSIYVAQRCCGQGMGRELERTISHLLKALGYRKLYALVTQENSASIAFHESVGFHRVAFFPQQGYKMGRWLGVFWLEKELCGEECALRFPKKTGELSKEELTSLLEEARK